MGACSSVPFIGIYASSYVMVVLLATLSGVALVVEGTRLRSPAINRLLVAWLKPLLKETEGRRITGATYIALSGLAAFLLFDKTVAIAALFFLAVGDPAAALVGSRVSGVRFFGKSPLGTLAFVAVAMAMAGILSAGGVVPSDVRVEWRVRSSTAADLTRNNAKVDRCFKAGALAVGAKVRITNIPGYFPLRHDPSLQELFHSNATILLGRDRISVIPLDKNRGGSTDMGDLSQIMPVCHPYTGGASGPGHSKEYTIKDYERAVINPAKIMAMVTIDLLADGAVKASEVLAKHVPAMTRDEYVEFQRGRATISEYDGSED